MQKKGEHFQPWQICAKNKNKKKSKNSLVEKALKSSKRQCNLLKEWEEFKRFGLAAI